jgi:hypothetical protein
MKEPLFKEYFSRKPERVIRHWYAYTDSLSISPSSFYRTIEEQIRMRQVPGLTVSNVEWSEGGGLSAKRVYLRLSRERFAFDICAAPFGCGFFFSCRFSELPLTINPFGVLFLLGMGWLCYKAFIQNLGFFWGLLALGTSAACLVWVLRNSVSIGLADLDASLIKTPLIGTIYERFLRSETFYREDTRLVYATIVPDIVKTEVEKVTAAHGIKLIDQYDYSPILGELYRKTTTQVKAPEDQGE